MRLSFDTLVPNIKAIFISKSSPFCLLSKCFSSTLALIVSSNSLKNLPQFFYISNTIPTSLSVAFLPLTARFLSPSLISIFFLFSSLCLFDFDFIFLATRVVWFHWFMFRFLFHLFCFNDFDMLVGVELDEFGVETGCEHHMFVNMHQREIEKQICLNFSNYIIFWGV